MRAMVGSFLELLKKKGLKVNENRIKRMMLRVEEGSVYEDIVDRRQVDCVSEFKYFGFCVR